MWLDQEAVVRGVRSSDVRRAPPEAYDQAAHNAAIARKRDELHGRINAEISAGSPAEFKWFALRITAGCERIAMAHLVARRFGVYMPCLGEMVYETGQWRYRENPILAGYIFISSIGLVGRTEAEGRWDRAKGCPGVAGWLVRAGTDSPAAIPESFIDELRGYEAAENARFDRVNGRTYDKPAKKAKGNAANRRAKERIKRKLKEQRRRARGVTVPSA